VGDRRRHAQPRAQEPLQGGLHRLGGRGVVRLLGVAADVAEAADREPSVGQLLPVLVATAQVHRPRDADLVGRGGAEHLQAHGADLRPASSGSSRSSRPSTATTTAPQDTAPPVVTTRPGARSTTGRPLVQDGAA
jgi:hypothetical protein